MSTELFNNLLLIIGQNRFHVPTIEQAFRFLDFDSNAKMAMQDTQPLRLTLVMPDIFAPSSSTDPLVQALRRQIQDGLLSPGEWLREARLCNEFGVGRTIARKALRTLADDGLVVIEENRGAYVAATTVQEVFDLYETRAALYGLAARFACIRATPKHMAETLKLIDALLAAAESGAAAEALIHQSETIFSRLASTASADAQKMIESVRRKTRWHYSYVSLTESPGGPFDHWRVVREGLASRNAAVASEGARNILYYMQNEAMRLMISRGYGLLPTDEVKPARSRKASA